MNSLKLAAIGTAAITVDARINVNPETRQFVDENNSTVIFHGVNVVYKMDPYIPSQGEFDVENSLNDEDIQNLKDWGMNFVRLGVMWEAVERTPGVYDTEYLAAIDKLITKLGEAGIYTLVDMHQDVFARSICGEGFPDFYAKEAYGKHPACINWLLDKKLAPIYDKLGYCKDMRDYGYRLDENGWPLIEDCQTTFFIDYYTSPQSLQSFKALYDNKNGLQDKFVDYWDVTSGALANNPYVVGFDPLNEPFPGNPTQNPKLVAPGYADRTLLAPMYERIFEKYMSHSQDSIMWFEPTMFPDVLPLGKTGVIIPVGFEQPPGGEIGSRNHALNDHSYCCSLGLSVCADGEPSTDLADSCLGFHEKRISQRSRDAERLGVPLMITEFGACLTEASCTQEISQVADVSDDYLVGWAYWEFKTYKDLTTSAGTGEEGFYNKDGTLQEWKVKALARSYLMTTQGVPTKFDFDMATSAFEAEFTVNTSITAPTVVFASKQYYYPNGTQVVVSVKG